MTNNEKKTRNDEIKAAVAARPKVKITREYGQYKVGEVVSLSEIRRNFLVANGHGVLLEK